MGLDLVSLAVGFVVGLVVGYLVKEYFSKSEEAPKDEEPPTDEGKS